MFVAQFWERFWTFAHSSIEALIIPNVFVLLIVLSVSLIAAIARQNPLRNEAWRWQYWFVFTQMIFFPATIAVGTLFPAAGAGPYHKENRLGRHLLDALFYLSLITGCFWAYRMKKLRWLAASIVGLQEVFVFSAGFIAGMSVSGDWL